MKSEFNFHMHTTYSDGGLTVEEIVQGLKEADVKAFAITDHDTVDGNVEAAVFAKQNGLTHYNGVEISTCFSNEIEGLDDTCVCHIVGLDFNLDEMRKYVVEFNENKNSVLLNLFNTLVADGFDIDKNNVIDENGNISARTLIAKELVRCGYASGTNAAFREILNSGKYRVFARNLPYIKDVVKAIHLCGGLAIWAHPFGYTRGGKRELKDQQVTELATFMFDEACPLDGLEAYYQNYDKDRVNFLNALADKYGVYKSIGTDYHNAQIDLVKYPEYAKKIRNESLCFNVDGVVVEDNIATVLAKRHGN